MRNIIISENLFTVLLICSWWHNNHERWSWMRVLLTEACYHSFWYIFIHIWILYNCHDNCSTCITKRETKRKTRVVWLLATCMICLGKLHKNDTNPWHNHQKVQVWVHFYIVTMICHTQGTVFTIWCHLNLTIFIFVYYIVLHIQLGYY